MSQLEKKFETRIKIQSLKEKYKHERSRLVDYYYDLNVASEERPIYRILIGKTNDIITDLEELLK